MRKRKVEKDSRKKHPVSQGSASSEGQRWVRWVALALGLALSVSYLLPILFKANFGKGTESSSTFVMVGYVPEYRVDHVLSHIDVVASCVTDVILFSASISPDAPHLEWRHLSQTQVTRFVSEAKTAGIKRIHLSIGGAGRSSGFKRVCSSEESISALVEEIVQVTNELELDGVDFDWESPVTQSDFDNYARLIQRTKAAFQNDSKQTSGLKTVSVTTHFFDDLGSLVYDTVDRVHLMAYDLNRRHSTLEDTKRALDILVTRRKARKDKVLVGIPVYGRGIQDHTVVQTYGEIVESEGPAAMRQDETAGGIYYNGVPTVREKVAWATEERLAGVFFWELGQDAFKDRQLSLIANSCL